jgi:hypothetical protein
VLSRSDTAITADFTGLRTNYDRGGRSGLAAAIERRTAARHHVDSVYLLADAAFAPLAGTLKRWPSELTGADGWGTFTTPE